MFLLKVLTAFAGVHKTELVRERRKGKQRDATEARTLYNVRLFTVRWASLASQSTLSTMRIDVVVMNATVDLIPCTLFRDSMASTSIPPVVVWLRRDLRLSDNPALHWAGSQQRPVLCVYIHDTTDDSAWQPGGATRWWLHHSLQSFAKDIKKAGTTLRLFAGEPEQVLKTLVAETGTDTLVWNRRYEPRFIDSDSQLKKNFTENGLTVQSFAGNYCHEPWQVMRDGKNPYRVFTAYWRASAKHNPVAMVKRVKSLQPYRRKPAGSLTVRDLALLPKQNWASRFPDTWTPGESAALSRLRHLLSGPISSYDTNRNIPSVEGTSCLSPHLAFGEISPRQINHAITLKVASGKLGDDENVETFRREIGWRDFACHLLYHYPHTTSDPLDTRYNKFPWCKVDRNTLARWQHGNTGIPFVDAGMRQLWQTGWMHNRVRMVVGSLLIKNMGYHWQHGAHWFWDTLVDADLASNSMGWQWVAGSGADAAPYFRVFNPVLQGERFDPRGVYIRQWVPEVSGLSDKLIHTPWLATEPQLSEAGIVLGSSYPHPVVDLARSRKDALLRFDKIK